MIKLCCFICGNKLNIKYVRNLPEGLILSVDCDCLNEDIQTLHKIREIVNDHKLLRSVRIDMIKKLVNREG